MIKNRLHFILRFLPLLVLTGAIHPKYGLDGFPFNNKIEVILFLTSLFCIFSRNKKIRKKTVLIFIFLSLSFLILHIFYQVHTYFPRHIMQGYLFMVISTVYLYLTKEESSVI